ncbi:hypothetical protein SDJN03_21771, partial [Cucurbita argyrosperma subsp. sororia]
MLRGLPQSVIRDVALLVTLEARSSPSQASSPTGALVADCADQSGRNAASVLLWLSELPTLGVLRLTSLYSLIFS